MQDVRLPQDYMRKVDAVEVGTRVQEGKRKDSPESVRRVLRIVERKLC